MLIGWSETEKSVVVFLAECYFFVEGRLEKIAAGMRALMAATCLPSATRSRKNRHRHTGGFTETVTCGKCPKVFSPGQVVNMKVQRNPLTLLYSRGRKLYCPTCKHVQHWGQQCFSDGTFLFPPVITCPPSYYYTDEVVNKFLADHPEADDVRFVEST